jgi:hypothetical protein
MKLEIKDQLVNPRGHACREFGRQAASARGKQISQVAIRNVFYFSRRKEMLNP